MNNVSLGGCITFIGNVYQTKNGVNMLNFGIGTKRLVKEKEFFESFEVVCYGYLIDYVQKYVEKGEYVLVTGSLSTRTSKTKEGVEYKKHVIYANDIESVRKSEFSAQENYKKDSEEDGYADISKATNGGAANILNQVTDDDLPF